VSYRLELRPQVSEDVGLAVAWYDARQAGLGARFALAVRDRIDELLPNPLSPRIRDHARGIRWVFPAPFPYRIIYRVSGEVVLVVAVIHAARRDREWEKRIMNEG
jgi:toxin ParE1/3/4